MSFIALARSLMCLDPTLLTIFLFNPLFNNVDYGICKIPKKWAITAKDEKIVEECEDYPWPVKGYMDVLTYQVFEKIFTKISFSRIPSRSEQFVQEQVIATFPYDSLVAREFDLTHEKLLLSNDLLFFHKKAFYFVEAKSAKPKKAEAQAKRRKSIYKDLLFDVGYDSWYGYYTPNTGLVYI